VLDTLPDGSVPPPLNPAQALTLGEALAAYTSGSSQLALGVAGRLRVGERADLVVENVDPFALPAEALASVRTEVTVVNGQVVYERGDVVAEAVLQGGELQNVGR
jgi:predicted amidohydrolase YtcJ